MVEAKDVGREAIRAYWRKHSAKYYRNHKDQILEKARRKYHAQKDHAGQRHGPVESEPHEKKKKHEKRRSS